MEAPLCEKRTYKTLTFRIKRKHKRHRSPNLHQAVQTRFFVTMSSLSDKYCEIDDDHWDKKYLSCGYDSILEGPWIRMQFNRVRFIRERSRAISARRFIQYIPLHPISACTCLTQCHSGPPPPCFPGAFLLRRPWSLREVVNTRCLSTS